ncbi:glycosyltransferase [candidate division WWE3 bacterium]|nr:glycosyltransferase [candidate division WWE3 bacterium]
MKIGIDCQYLSKKYPAGPEKYLINLLNALSKTDKSNNYTLYFKSTPSQKLLKTLTNASSNFYSKVLNSNLSWTQHALTKELLKNPPDVFFTAFHTLPVLATFPPFKALKKTKIVSMIHGIDYIYEYKNPLRKFWEGLPLRYTAYFSDAIIVPAAHTKEKLSKFPWLVASKKITVIPEGVDNRFKKYSQDQVKQVQEKFNLAQKPYFLFISTIQPRKNIPNLVAGFAQALKSDQIPENAVLALAGKKGWDYEESLEAPQKYNVQKNVKFLGRISDQDLPPLLSGATAFVSTSFEEGFGLPLLEAMASEVPCVVSEIPSYKALAKETAVFVDPYDPDSIAKGLAEASTTNPQTLKKAKETAQKYSWEETAKKTLQVFKNT